MRILGITAEYDPFHNGHAYHLNAARKAASPDATVCVMSGDFTQRGELAIMDKWKRANIAADQGLDLVLELPFLYAVSPAPGFAKGAVDILVAAGATHIAFGCEAEKPDELRQLAGLQLERGEEIETITREEMKSGLSHVKARQKASEQILGEELTRLSLAPNNILALEYLKRMMYWERRGRKVEAIPVLRKGSGYKEASQYSDSEIKYAGGSAIRDMIEVGWDVSEFLPYDYRDYSDMDGAYSTRGWLDLAAAGKDMLRQLKVIALRNGLDVLPTIRFVGEGIENKLIREIMDAEVYKELLVKLTSRRYTTSTIRRMLLYILMGITGDEADEIIEGNALYGRVLAMTDAGRKLIASRPPLPFIVNCNRTEGLSERAKKCLQIDIKAADIYNVLAGRDTRRCTDHRQKPYVKEGEK